MRDDRSTVSVRYPGDEKICPENWTRNFDSCAFMELATPDFCATGRQWILLLATTLRQRDEVIRQRDEARREAEASLGDKFTSAGDVLENAARSGACGGSAQRDA